MKGTPINPDCINPDRLKHNFQGPDCALNEKKTARTAKRNAIPASPRAGAAKTNPKNL
jgi:hypothetical protein